MVAKSFILASHCVFQNILPETSEIVDRHLLSCDTIELM